MLKVCRVDCFVVITGPLPSFALFVAASISSLVATDAAITLLGLSAAMALSGLSLCWLPHLPLPSCVPLTCDCNVALVRVTACWAISGVCAVHAVVLLESCLQCLGGALQW